MARIKETMAKLIDQYFITLEKQFKDAQVSRGVDLSKVEGIVAQLEELFKHRSLNSWQDAYRAEQLLIPILPDQRLDSEINRRMRQSRKMLDPETIKAYAEEPRDTATHKRSLLANLTADLQWAYSSRTLRRECLHCATVTGCWFFIGAFILFFLSIMFSSLLIHLLNYGTYLMLHAILAGALGASYSTLTTVKTYPQDVPVEKVQTLCSFGYILSRILIGLCAAQILVFFLQSGVFSGELIPCLDREHIASMEAPDWRLIPSIIIDKRFSLLTIYSFLAGFSEKLIPNLLSTVEAKVQSQGKG